MAESKIEWTEATWNPVVGCTKIAAGCKNCYAERIHNQRHRAFLAGKKMPEQYAKPFNEIQILPERIEQPLHWRKPRKIFWCSMSDMFHPDVRDEYIWEICQTIKATPQHTHQILTKRIERVYEFYNHRSSLWRLPNLWLGVSCSTQADADKNIPILLPIPAAVHYVSFEPLLEEIYIPGPLMNHGFGYEFNQKPGRIDWAIVGCESGPNPRPCNIEWVRDIVRHCKIADIACFVKQIDLNGKVSKEPKEWPADLRIREYPS